MGGHQEAKTTPQNPLKKTVSTRPSFLANLQRSSQIRDRVQVKIPTDLRGRALHPRKILRYPNMNTTGPEREQKIMRPPHFPTTAPKMRLSSTGSAASNFQSFPHPSLSSPRKMRQSNNLSAGWVVVRGNIQSEAGRASLLRGLLGVVVFTLK